MSTGMDYVDGSLSVTLNGTAVAASKYKITYDTDTHELKVVFVDFLKNFKAYAGQSLVVKYKAVLNDNAYDGTTSESNKANLVYSNDPTQTYTGDPDDPDVPDDDNPNYTPVVGITPDQTVYTYATTLVIHKKDENGRALTGAEFMLSSQDGKTNIISKVRIDKTTKFELATDGTFYKLATGAYTTVAPAADGSTAKRSDSTTEKYVRKVETKQVLVDSGTNKIIGEVDAGGYLYFRGIAEGHYTLTETKTPSSKYNAIDPIDFTITMGGTSRTDVTWGVTKSTNSEYVTMDASSDKLSILVEVINTKGSQLPETGGKGTTLFYIIGGILVFVTTVLLITKKRMNASKK
jgi:LPXTG-motif cell wall-anchored protein